MTCWVMTGAAAAAAPKRGSASAMNTESDASSSRKVFRAFAAILDERVPAAVRAQVHAPPQVFHRLQVLYPEHVVRLEERAACGKSERLFSHLLLFLLKDGDIGPSSLKMLAHRCHDRVGVPHEERAALRIHERTLMVQDVVKAEDVLPGVEIHPFYLFLC